MEHLEKKDWFFFKQRIGQVDSTLMDFNEIVYLEHCFLMIWGYTLYWQWYDSMDKSNTFKIWNQCLME